MRQVAFNQTRRCQFLQKHKTSSVQEVRGKINVIPMLKAIGSACERVNTWMISKPGCGYSNTGSCSSIFMSPISSGSAPWLTRYTTSCNKLVPTCKRGRQSCFGWIIDGKMMTLPAALNCKHMHLPEYSLTCNLNGFKSVFGEVFSVFCQFPDTCTSRASTLSLHAGIHGGMHWKHVVIFSLQIIFVLTYFSKVRSDIYNRIFCFICC